jgi:hypothetical protein
MRGSSHLSEKGPGIPSVLRDFQSAGFSTILFCFSDILAIRVQVYKWMVYRC